MSGSGRFGRLALLLALSLAPACLLEELDRSRLDVWGGFDAPDATEGDGDGAEDAMDADDDGNGDDDGSGDDDGAADGDVAETCGNGRPDPGETCEHGDSITCSNVCGNMGGTQTCQDDCVMGPCIFPTMETCDGADDDGDTLIDDCIWCADDPPGTGLLHAVAIGADGTVWAAGEADPSGSLAPEVWRRDPTAGSWTAQTSGIAGRVEALGFVGGELLAVGTSSRVYTFDASGSSWGPFGSPLDTGTLHDLYGTALDQLWVVGDHVDPRTAVVRQWNGDSWLTFATTGADGVDFRAIDGNPAIGTIWAAGSDGAIFRHLPGATTTIGGSPSLYGIHVVSDDDVWTVGEADGRGIVYRWNGTAWTEVPTPPGPRFTDVWATADGVHAWILREETGEILHWSIAMSWVREFGPRADRGLRRIEGDDSTGEMWAVGDGVVHLAH